MEPFFLEFVRQHLGVADPQHIERIAELAQPIQLEKGQYLVQRGEVCERVILLKKGLMRGFIQRGPDDAEVTFIFAAEGAFVTALASFVNRTPTEETLQALENCEGYALTRDNLLTLYEALPATERYGRIFFERLCAELLHRLSFLISETALERYERLERENPTVLQRAPQHMIASYLGVAPQSLSRLRAARKG
jgi:CRP-like cAMP-binding protein